MANFDRFDEEPIPIGGNAQATFRSLVRNLDARTEPDDSPHGQLIYALSVLEQALVVEKGEDWVNEDYLDFLGTLRELLGTEPRFTEEQKRLIHFSIDEIAACGRELEETGESTRAASEAIAYLIERTVDWCRWHPTV